VAFAVIAERELKRQPARASVRLLMLAVRC
jgi:hypothetical protein